MPLQCNMPTKRKWNSAQRSSKRARLSSTMGVPGYGFRAVRPFTQEMNFLDTSVASQAVNTTGTVRLLNGMQYGTGATQHIGLKARLKSLEYYFWVYNDSTANINVVDVWIVYDANPNGVTPNFGDIITNDQFIYLPNRDRFKILKRHKLTLAGAPSNPTDSTVVRDNGYLKMDFDQVFNTSNVGSIADIQTGAVWLVAYGTSNSGTSDCSIDFRSRLRYVA